MSEEKFASYLTALDEGFKSGDARADDKQVESANIEVIQNVVRAIGRGDLGAVGALLADDVVLEIRSGLELPFIHDARGRGAVLDAMRHNFGAIREQRPTIEAVVAQGDTVVVTSHEEGELAGGERYSVHGMHRYVVRDGRIALIHELVVPLKARPD
jgi:ketosteroid isomerase-like protein